MKPRPKERITSSKGSKIIESRLTDAWPIDFATPKEMAKTTKPTASSNATTGRRMSVSGPLALYWRTTISVAAGAVAAATAPKVIAAGKGSSLGIAKCSPTNAISTKIVVKIA